MWREAVSAFIGAMQAFGLIPVEPIADKLAAGEFIRFECEGDRKGKANGWARLFLDGHPAGRFGNYRLAIDTTWKSDAPVSACPLPIGLSSAVAGRPKRPNANRLSWLNNRGWPSALTIPI